MKAILSKEQGHFGNLWLKSIEIGFSKPLLRTNNTDQCIFPLVADSLIPLSSLQVCRDPSGSQK